MGPKIQGFISGLFSTVYIDRFCQRESMMVTLFPALWRNHSDMNLLIFGPIPLLNHSAPCPSPETGFTVVDPSQTAAAEEGRDPEQFGYDVRTLGLENSSDLHSSDGLTLYPR